MDSNDKEAAEKKLQMKNIRTRIEHSVNSGDPVPLNQAFDQIAELIEAEAQCFDSQTFDAVVDKAIERKKRK